MKKLENKTVLITGATSGMGEAFARLFATEGADVIIVGRNIERGMNVQNSILENNGKAKFFPCDVTKESEIIELKRKEIIPFTMHDDSKPYIVKTMESKLTKRELEFDLEIPKSFDSPRIIFAVQLAFAKLLSQSYHKAKLMSTIF